MLPTDIEKRIRSDAKEHADEFLRRVTDFSRDHPGAGERVLRCIVYLAQGDRDQLTHALRLATLDWRDVIVAAEYESNPAKTSWRDEHLRVRDMNRPFA